MKNSITATQTIQSTKNNLSEMNNNLIELNQDFDLSNFLTKDLISEIDNFEEKSPKENSNNSSFSKRKNTEASLSKSQNEEAYFSNSLENIEEERDTIDYLKTLKLDSETTETTNEVSNTSTDNKTEEKKVFVQRDGDWDCMKCKNLNFAFRTNCNRCKCSKIDSEAIKNNTMKMMASCIQYTQMMQVRMMTMFKMAQIQATVQKNAQNTIKLNTAKAN